MKREPSEPQGLDLTKEKKAFAAIDTEALKKELEEAGVPWMFVEASLDYIKNPPNSVWDSYEYYKEKGKDMVLEVLKVTVESHMRYFTPSGWIEPLRSPLGHMDAKAIEITAKVALKAFYPEE
ncbi:MAG: hypothetical protein ABIH21_02320 [Patescibacteria group bacterium]